MARRRERRTEATRPRGDGESGRLARGAAGGGWNLGRVWCWLGQGRFCNGVRRPAAAATFLELFACVGRRERRPDPKIPFLPPHGRGVGARGGPRARGAEASVLGKLVLLGRHAGKLSLLRGGATSPDLFEISTSIVQFCIFLMLKSD